MSLILRNNLTRALTHDELDGNLIYLNISEWVKKGYLKGQYVLIKTESIGLIYYCEATHTDFIYDLYGSGNFIDTYFDGTITHKLWRQIGYNNSDDDVATITGYTLNNTITSIQLSDGTIYDIDLNEVKISGDQYSIGISNHSYESITNTWQTEVISGETYNTVTLQYGSVEQPSKLNIVVIDLNTTEDKHHLVKLPQNLNIDDAGVIYKIIAKNNNNSNLDKYLMVFSEEKRLISVNVRTKYNDSYFIPLETMENVEIIWDGYDYLVTNIVKQGYVSLNAKNFIEMNTDIDQLFDTCYIERNINNFL
jgi:hypothetical protein